MERSETHNPHVFELQTRLLQPFFFDGQSRDEISAGLGNARFKGRRVWQQFDADSISDELYRTESYDSCLHAVFGPKGEGNYFSLIPEMANAMFSRQLKVTTADLEPYHLRFVKPKRVAEIFLSPFGTGVLSLTVALEAGDIPLTLDTSLILNYRLSQLKDWSGTKLRIPHPSEDIEKWSSIPENKRAQIPDSPSADNAIENRLNAPGGSFTVSELLKYLLMPISEVCQFRAYESHANIYTVTRLSSEFDFADASICNELSTKLSALAQVEEHIHAGAIPGTPSIENLILNRNHWAAVGSLGAVHVVSDQSGDIAFNEERLQRSRDRYFVPYLLAFQQRLAIENANERVGRTIRSTASKKSLDSCAPEFRSILRDMIEFNSLWYLPEVSRREVVNRYYHLAQNGLGVPRAWRLANECVENLDAACRTCQQETQSAHAAETLDKQAEVLEESRELHAKVEWVEVFIIAVYFAELVHIAGLSFDHTYVGLSALGFSLVAMTAALLVLKPWKSLRLKGLAWASTLAFLAIFAYMVVGFLFFSGAHDAGHGSTVHDESHESGKTLKDEH